MTEKRPSLMSAYELAGLPEVTLEMERTTALFFDFDDANVLFKFPDASGQWWEPLRAGEQWFKRRLRA